ncbi:ABC transporter permease [Pseudaestuariivita sp.]|uniref:ABC transporter permease n=1 Tax=Pseudaestuariivita sp. TaxID=2211669 RepID=UPI004058B958
MSATYILVRCARVFLTVWAAATLVFVALRIAGDPVMALVPPDLPDDIIDQYRARFGFDRTILEQYWLYLAAIAQGDFGLSFRTNGPAVDLVSARIGATAALMVTALAISVLVGVPAGIAAALHHNRTLDRTIMAFAVFGFAMPNFFFGILLILLFTLNLQWLPSGGFESWQSLIMPAATLGLAGAGAYARLTRSALLEVLGGPFMQTARAKGLPPRRQILVHGLRAILVPLFTLLGFSVGALISGAIVTETVFAWPGIGRLLVVSVSERDLAVVQLIIILSAAMMAITNAVVDLLLGVLDPRIGTARSQGR